MKKAMTRPAPTAVMSNLTVLAKHGMFALVNGIYPDGLVRSLTRSEERRAIKALKSREIAAEMTARPGTSKPAFAIVPLRFVTEHENDYGEIHP